MNLKYSCLLTVFIIISCNKSEPNLKEIIKIDPRAFSGNEIALSYISDDIRYISLDNSILIGDITSFEIARNSIYVNSCDTLLIKYDRTGQNPQRIGRRGRGPGEYATCKFYAIDNNSGKIYIHGRNYSILVYSGDGNFLKSIQLSQDVGFGAKDMAFFGNSDLFIGQNTIGSQNKYDWVILDTLGNIKSYKENPISPFETKIGVLSGIIKFKENISYWNSYQDTIFTVFPDYAYKVFYMLTPGEHRAPKKNSSLKQMFEYYTPILFFETQNYLIHRYTYRGKRVYVFINKEDSEAFIIPIQGQKTVYGGIANDLDGGPVFRPACYFIDNSYEYLAGVVQTLELKSYVASNDFQNSTPKYPEKKKELERLANSLDENDNPVLMLVKLKN